MYTPNILLVVDSQVYNCMHTLLLDTSTTHIYVLYYSISDLSIHKCFSIYMYISIDIFLLYTYKEAYYMFVK